MIASLSNDFSNLGGLIKTLGKPSVSAAGNVTIRAHYLPFRNGKPMTGELLDTIRGYICNFAMSRAEIDAVHQSAVAMTPQQRMIAYNKLRDDAADLFIKAQKSTGRSGECGELLLYLLTEWILEAPQIMAKMSLKTNAQMPVHGSDGIHIKYDVSSDRLVFFWGEAKLHATIKGGIWKAVESIASTLKYDKLKEDINLVRRYVSLSGLLPEAQKKIVEFLDPLSPSYAKKLDASVCLIGFNFRGFSNLSSVPAANLEAHFERLLAIEIDLAQKKLEADLQKAGVTHHTMEVFFIPVISVDELRVDFQNRIGWKQ
jgi:hypothetical protein